MSQVKESCIRVIQENSDTELFILYILSYWSVIICQVYSSRKHISMVYFLLTIKAHLLWQPPFLQYALQWCYNYLSISSSMAEILLFNLVFHDRVTSVSVSTLKPLLRVIGAILLKP